MTIYQRSGKINSQETSTNPNAFEKSEQEEDQGVKVNGFAQVLDLLRVADPEFRESLLKRLAEQDPSLANDLRYALSKL